MPEYRLLLLTSKNNAFVEIEVGASSHQNVSMGNIAFTALKRRRTTGDLNETGNKNKEKGNGAGLG